jgi:hypothetical protein
LLLELFAGAHPGNDADDGQDDREEEKNHDEERGSAARQRRRVGQYTVGLSCRLRLLVSTFLVHLYAFSVFIF